MSRDDIFRMALEAGGMPDGFFGDRWVMYTQEIERFAALVAAAEREACARMFDDEVRSYNYITDRIRARGDA